MKLYKLFMKYKYCIAGILIFVIIYNSTQSIVENMSDAQKRKKIKEEKLSIKHLDGALTYFESIVKSEDERLMVTVDASRKKKILAALDKMDYWINNSIVMMIFRSKAKTQSKYYNELVKFFGKEGRHLKMYQERIEMIRKALKAHKPSSSLSSSKKSTKKKSGGSSIFNKFK